MIVSLLACAAGPSSPVDDGPRFVGDDDGLLQAAWDEWIGAAGEGRIHIDRVVVEDLDDTPSAYTYWPWNVVHIDPDAADPVGELYYWLCVELDEREGLAEGFDRTPEAFAEDCREGPAAYAAASALLDACGVASDDAAFAEVVYPFGAAAALDVLPGPTIRIGEVSTVVPAGGGRWAILAYADDHASAWLQDEATGGRQLVAVKGPDESVGWRLFGGPDAAALFVWDRETGDRTVRSLGTGEPVAVADDTVPWEGVVSAGHLFGAPITYTAGDTVEEVDLADGASRTLDVPRVEGEDLLLEGLYPTPDGVVVDVADADVEVDYDVVMVTLYGRWLHPYDVATGTFGPALAVPDGFLGAGVLGDDLLVGSVQRDGAAVPAAIDLADGDLLVSDALCLPDARPTMSSGDAVWSWDGATLASLSLP